MTDTTSESPKHQHSKAPALDPALLLQAYRIGAFPMADPKTGEIDWYAPDPRAVIDLSKEYLPRSLKAVIRKGVFEVRWDTAFEAVMERCAARPETWISTAIIQAYTALHRAGSAHSVETWSGGRLAGGLYGVAIGGAFFGESMFSDETDASKVALVALTDRLRERGFGLLDTQFITPHLQRFGAVEIARADYQERLRRSLRLNCVLVP